MINLQTINFFDTSALLGGYKLSKNETNYISNIVFQELEKIKTSHEKDESIKYKARSLVRYLMSHRDMWIENCANWGRVEKLLSKSPTLQDNNDSRLICEARLLAASEKTNLGIPEDMNPKVFKFITADASQFLLACGWPQLHATYYNETSYKEALWKGYQEFHLTEAELASFYENSEKNTLNLKTNEYAIIYLENEIVDLIKWDGSKNEIIKYKPQNSDFFGKVAPLNDQQKFFFDLLQNRNIPVKVIRGQYGSGKTFLALVHALNYVTWHKFDKIVFVRNNVEVAGSQKLGALPGEQEDKLMPFLMPLADHLGDVEALLRYMDEGKIEPIHLGYIRGRSFRNSIILVDEAENLTTDNVKLIIGRAGPGSEVWFLGDESQTDSDIFRKNSGIASLINSLGGNPLFGTIELQKSERSAVAQLAAIIHGES